MKRILNKSIVLNLLLLTAGCTQKPSEPAGTGDEVNKTTEDLISITQAQFDQNQMQVGTLEEQAFPVVVATSGTIDVPPQNRAVVNATMGGYIKTTPLLVGDYVQKGQVLVTLENPEFVTLQQQYMETHEQLTYLKAEYDRQVSMKMENITSQKSYLKAESDYKSAVARYKGLEKHLQLLHISTASVRAGNISSVATIYAPIAGNIAKVHVTKGSYVSPATPILEIVDKDHIHLELAVFEKDIMQVKKGQAVEFRIPEASPDTYKAQVYLVGTTLSPNRTIQVHAHLNNEDDNQFLVGMFVEAGIVVRTAFAKALPQEAVVQINDQEFVLMRSGTSGSEYIFKKLEVTVVDRHAGYVTIAVDETITDETQFLIKGAFNLIGE